ncbi:MAG: thioredoxin [Rhodospirillales bacterium]|nr:thioredoxin [Rhodospirillales bacterium]
MEFIINQGGGGARAGAGAPGMGGGAGPAGDVIKDVTAATFMADVIEASKKVPVIVDFWATWCGPCKQLGPLLEKLVRQANGKVRLVKIDIDRNQDLAAQLRIQSVPTVYAFAGGRPVDAFVGAQPESQIKAFIGRLMGGADAGPGIEDVLAEADALLAQGDAAAASQLFAEILKLDPENGPALGGVARCYLAVGDQERAEQVLAQVPPKLTNHPAILQVKSAIDLAKASAGAAGQTAELRKRLALDANDHQARFDLAMAYYGTGEREAAVDELLELVRRNRAWNEQAARQQLVKLFEAFGPTDPLTIEARKRLSSILFS